MALLPKRIQIAREIVMQKQDERGKMSRLVLEGF
jgi:hypothetical protein